MILHRPVRRRPAAVVLLACSLLILSGCKWVRVDVSPADPKQGEVVTFVINAGEPSDIVKVDYTIGSMTGTTTTVPHQVSINTCKTGGTYYTTIAISATATYKDGSVKTTTGSINLTVGKDSREDTDRNYVCYIADENDGTINDVRSGWANAFQDEFDAFSQTQYYWAQPAFFTTSALYYANSADMTLFLGHGNPHQYRAGPTGSDWVDFSSTEFGNMAPCNATGDVEYLVSAACQLLSMDAIGGNPWRFYWKHEYSTRLQKRPFTGLHMICGFRTNHHYDYWWWFGWHSSSTGFFDQFAGSLDDNHTVRDSWLDAAGDELDFDDGNNRTAVFYLRAYENARINTHGDDYIYGNTNYIVDAEYWE
jgi:hypothetical protein